MNSTSKDVDWKRKLFIQFTASGSENPNGLKEALLNLLSVRITTFSFSYKAEKAIRILGVTVGKTKASWKLSTGIANFLDGKLREILDKYHVQEVSLSYRPLRKDEYNIEGGVATIEETALSA